MLLRDKDKTRLLAIAGKTIKTPIEILAFGSRVDGSAHSGSDLDLVIRTKNKLALDIGEFVDFKEQLTSSNIPILIQVLDWGRIPDYFKDNIIKNYETLKADF